MARKVYLQGGPKDGEYMTIGDDWKEVVYTELPPASDSISFRAPLVLARKFRYRPQGRRTLQGVEVFECD